MKEWVLKMEQETVFPYWFRAWIEKPKSTNVLGYFSTEELARTRYSKVLSKTCPSCGSKTIRAMGVAVCSQCDWTSK